MAANGVNTSEDAEMSVCEGDSVTMMDVLKEQQDFEDNANAVLGASDDKNCTYAKGYVKRQAIYACLTCCPEAKVEPSKRAGVCLACSLHCHENHELVELYTKRNFRCDCGNPKLNSHPCQFTPNKNDLNYENKYNQNFSGIYCVCHRPYPDPENVEEEEEMIQCIVCEDWLHTNHLEATVPDNDLYEEMICKDCMEEYDFLHDYSDLVVNVVDKEVVVDEFDFDFDLKKSSRKGKSKKTVTNGKVDLKSDVDDKANSSLTNGEDKKNTETTPEKIDDKVNEVCADNLTNENNDSKVDTSSSEVENKDIDKTDQSEVSADNLINNENNDSNIEKKDIDKTDQSDAEKPVEDVKPEEAVNGESQPEGKNTESIISEENKTDSFEANEKVEESTEKSDANDNIAEQDKKLETTEEQEKNNIEDQDKMEEDQLLQDDIEINPVTEQNTENTELPDTKKNDDETSKASDKNDIVDPEPTETKSSDAMETENSDTLQKKEDDTAETNPDKTKTDEETKAVPDTVESSDNKRKLSEEIDDELDAKKPKLDGKPCIRPRGVKRVYKGATFWPSNLRQKLCTCNECLSMYKDLAVLFLIDPEDTVNAYEALGKEISDGPSSQYEKGLQALSSLDRVHQINALTEYNKMRDKLLDFLKGYKDRKEIVKEEDIKSFFAGMKPKREPDGVYFCR